MPTPPANKTKKRKRSVTENKEKPMKIKEAKVSESREAVKPKKKKVKKAHAEVTAGDDDLEIVPSEPATLFGKTGKIGECNNDLDSAPVNSSKKSKKSKKMKEVQKEPLTAKKNEHSVKVKKNGKKSKTKSEIEKQDEPVPADGEKQSKPVVGSLFGGSLPGDQTASSASLFGGSLPGDVAAVSSDQPKPEDSATMKARCLKVRGLPFKVTVEEIVDFFREFRIKPEMVSLAKKNAKASRTKRDGSILLPGEALVTFPKHNIMTKALKMHGEKLGGRYVELIPVAEGSVVAAAGPNPQGNPSEVFVRYLPYDATTEDVMVFFLECGEVQRVKMFPDPAFPGRNKGICFVIFKEADSVPKALAMTGTDFWGRKLEITKGSDMALKKQEKNNEKIKKESFKATSRKEELPPSPSIWLTNLAFTVTEEEINKFLEPHRAVTVKLMTDARTGEPNGRCLLVFPSIDDAKQAMEKNGGDVAGRPARMAYAPNRTQPPGNSQVFVQYLPYTSTEESIKEAFKEAGRITRVKLMRDEEGDCKGIGFVTFSIEEEAHAFVSEWNGYAMGGRHIQVSMAKR